MPRLPLTVRATGDVQHFAGHASCFRRHIITSNAFRRGVIGWPTGSTGKV